MFYFINGHTTAPTKPYPILINHPCGQSKSTFAVCFLNTPNA